MIASSLAKFVLIAGIGTYAATYVMGSFMGDTHKVINEGSLTAAALSIVIILFLAATKRYDKD